MTSVSAVVSDINLDFDRALRTGLDEAVFARSKSPAQIDAILESAGLRGVRLLLTHLSADKYAKLDVKWRAHLDYCELSSTAFFLGGLHAFERGPPRIAIVAGGTSDAGVAREAERTLRFNGVASIVVMDVGVAGLWRLMQRLEEIRACPVIIAVAGMDAALPTVLGGLVAGLIIAVPTSVGYGVATGGHTALNALLASCASGITVVNIDNGYGAACAALRALRVTRATPGEASG